MTLDLRPAYEKVIPSMVALRRDIHSHPELSFEEERTSGIVADGLRELGLEVKTGVGGTGVTGLLRGGSGGTDAAHQGGYGRVACRGGQRCGLLLS